MQRQLDTPKKRLARARKLRREVRNLTVLEDREWSKGVLGGVGYELEPEVARFLQFAWNTMLPEYLEIMKERI